MRQKVLSCVAAAMLAAVLCGCQGKPLPEGMEEEALLSQGREAVAMLAAGDCGAVRDMMREDVAAGVTEEDIQTLVRSQTDGAGAYKEISGAMATGQSSDGESYGVAVLYCKYAKRNVLYRLAFDTNYELIGIEIRKQ